MTIRQRFPAIAAVCLTLILGASFFVLPSLGTEVFLSPDETAAVATARAFGSTGTMRLHNLFLEDPQWFPWVHPRSFVSQYVRGGVLMPVGFLGMPVLFDALSKLFGDIVFAAGTPLLALSVLIPLWRLMRRFGKTAQFVTVVTWLTFPAVILYANRGMFPNLPALCLTIWVSYLLIDPAQASREIRKTSKYRRLVLRLVVAGCLTGLALAIRPTEAIWILPWVALAFFLRERGKSVAEKADHAIYVIVACVAVCFLFAWIGKITYGEWFQTGYQLRDPVENYNHWNHDPFWGVQDLSAAVKTADDASKSLLDTFPFGFHPRNVWFNIKWYLLFFLMPWFVLSAGAFALAWMKEKQSRIPILVVSASIVGLCMLYGQGLYQDHIRANFVSVGNSFLRYLLPVSVISGVSIGWLAGWVEKWQPKYGRFIVISVVACLGAFGIWSATIRDDEGLWQNRIELKKYAETRERAKEFLPDDAVVVSERSDKIFFPEWQAVSPMVSRERLKEFMERNPGKLALFLRTVTPEQEESWRTDSFVLKPVLEMGNETLYLASPL